LFKQLQFLPVLRNTCSSAVILNPMAIIAAGFEAKQLLSLSLGIRGLNHKLVKHRAYQKDG
jgi:hypothetical protein